MQLDKPQPRATRIIARDARTGKSKAITIYNAAPDQVINRIKRLFAQDLSARRLPWH